MKAILVQYNPNNNKLRAKADGLKTITESRNYMLDLAEQEMKLAYEMLAKMNPEWYKDYQLSDGVLPNGDAVFTIVRCKGE
jgi:3-deoxy-D-arabino-heptulosonate 7-phosphate (DAHP) synthase